MPSPGQPYVTWPLFQYSFLLLPAFRSWGLSQSTEDILTPLLPAFRSWGPSQSTEGQVFSSPPVHSKSWLAPSPRARVQGCEVCLPIGTSVGAMLSFVHPIVTPQASQWWPGVHLSALLLSDLLSALLRWMVIPALTMLVRSSLALLTSHYILVFQGSVQLWIIAIFWWRRCV